MKWDERCEIITGEGVVAEVMRQLGPPYDSSPTGDAQGIGVLAPSGRILGGLVFHSWTPEHGYIEITGAGRGPWLTLPLLTGSFSYASSFVDRVVFRTSEHNTRAARTLKALGAEITLIPALRGPNEGELFCIIHLSSFKRRLGKFYEQRRKRAEGAGS